ncbi:Chaperone protein DnaJ [Vibrio aerogenes CECT 7868]|uniref:Chaperone protein DnaJ n=1 Tax=Vibrio aerogenes CECT 7868 TaxID=1216006 RepID=A0A1M5ZW40_9VIBR|nr:J domain-containing protein [Vibrio aerogenes]SHI28376.1 Chaperone protein DnaJ [Vibrio aerogenes CECT 7868]
MNFWEILELEPTSDKNIIKKAYRTKLRQYHPEEDPEGFKQVREAYEAAMIHTKDIGKIIQSPQRQEPEQSQTHSHVLTQALYTMLGNSNQRFSSRHWQQWFQQVLQAPIKEQELISDATLKLVLSNRWLPGEVINWIWRGLGWEILLKGTSQETEVCEFLDQWRHQQSLIALSELTGMSSAQQRGILSYLRPLQNALEDHWPNAINYLFTQPMPWVLHHSPQLAFSVLRAARHCPAISGNIVQYFLSGLTGDVNLSGFSAEQLQLIAQTYLRLGHQEQADKICSRLYLLEAQKEAAEIQYQLAIQSHSAMAPCFAFLHQQWTQLPAIYWRAERPLYKIIQDKQAFPLYSWIYNQLISQPDNRFNHQLDLRDQSGQYGLLLHCFWAGLYGSWACISEQLERLSDQSEESDEWKTLYQLTEYWLKHLLSARAGTHSLLTKLDSYGQDHFFEQSELTDEELHSLSPADWRELLCRHPLIPDQWFIRLMDEDLINTDILDESPLYPYYVDTLCFYRCVNSRFRLTSPWENQSFAGCFNWATIYYGQLVTSFTPDNSGLAQYLPPLPASLSESALCKFIPFIDAPEQYHNEAIEAFSEHPEQFVLRYITNNQIQLLTHTCSTDTLISLARQGEAPAYAALSIKWQQEHFEEAIICWNLLVIAAKEKAQYNAVIDWQQQALQTIRRTRELEQDYYEFAKPEILYWMLLKETEHFDPPEEIAGIIPDKEARIFHYPMFYIITQLQHGISQDGYDISPLKPLIRHQDEFEVCRQKVSNLALGEFEFLCQQHLELELDNQKIKSYSKSRLKYYFLLMVICWLFNILTTLYTAPVGHTSAYGYNPIFSGVLLAYECFITWRVTQYLFMRSSQVYYLCFVFMTLMAAGIFNMKIFIVMNLSIHFFFIYSLSPLRANGFWEKRIIRQRKIDLKSIFSAF